MTFAFTGTLTLFSGLNVLHVTLHSKLTFQTLGTISVFVIWWVKLLLWASNIATKSFLCCYLRAWSNENRLLTVYFKKWCQDVSTKLQCATALLGCTWASSFSIRHIECMLFVSWFHLLVSDVIWKYHNLISVFSHHASVFRIDYILSLPFCLPISNGLCPLCPDWPVQAAPLSDRWHWYEQISCSCLVLWFAFADNRVSASDIVGRPICLGSNRKKKREWQ